MAKSQFPSFPRSWIIYVLGIFIIHSKYFPNSDLQKKNTHNSPSPVTDDQIWKNFVFNEEMTSKMQSSTV